MFMLSQCLLQLGHKVIVVTRARGNRQGVSTSLPLASLVVASLSRALLVALPSPLTMHIFLHSIRLCVCICMYVYINVCIYIYIYTYVYTITGEDSRVKSDARFACSSGGIFPQKSPTYPQKSPMYPCTRALYVFMRALPASMVTYSRKTALHICKSA